MCNFASAQLEADFDGMPIAMHPMRIESRTMVEYITAESNIVSLAIIVSIFVRGDASQDVDICCDDAPVWVMDCNANDDGN